MTSSANDTSIFATPALAELIAATPTVDISVGETLFQSGQPCTHLPLLVAGNARVFASGQSGRQVTLYRLQPDDVCAISLSALLQDSRYPATASAETAVQVRYLDGEKFQAIIRQVPEAFTIFLDSFASCLYDSVCTARQLMFDPLDMRLAHLLHNRFADSPDEAINLTHEDIAHELGTTRVVASRMLKKLEHANCIRLCRRKIALHDADALRALVNNSGQVSSPA